VRRSKKKGGQGKKQKKINSRGRFFIFRGKIEYIHGGKGRKFKDLPQVFRKKEFFKLLP